MKEHDATEVAYKNGYRAGKEESQEIIARLEQEVARLKAVADAELDTIHDLGDDYARELEGVERLKMTLEIVEQEYSDMFTINRNLMAEVERLKKPQLFKVRIAPNGFGRIRAHNIVYELGAKELAERLYEKLYSIPTIYNAQFRKMVNETLTELMTKGE